MEKDNEKNKKRRKRGSRRHLGIAMGIGGIAMPLYPLHCEHWKHCKRWEWAKKNDVLTITH